MKQPKSNNSSKKEKQHLAMPLMAGAAGIEPALTVLETAVLPLNHAPRQDGLYPFPSSFTINLLSKVSCGLADRLSD